MRRFAGFADDRFAALGTLGWHGKFRFAASAFFYQHRYHFRDHFTGFVDDNRIADSHVFFADKIFIMERGPADGRAGNENRSQDGCRC